MASKKRQTGEALHALFREIFVLREILAEIMDDVHARTGLTTPQRKILRALEEVGRATVPDIALRLGTSRQFIQTEVNRLLAISARPTCH